MHIKDAFLVFYTGVFFQVKKHPHRKAKKKKRFYCALKTVCFCSKANAGFWQPTDGNMFNVRKVNCHYSRDWKWMSARGNYCQVFFLLEDFVLHFAKSLEQRLFLSVADLHKSIMQRKSALVCMCAYCRFQHSDWNSDPHIHRAFSRTACSAFPGVISQFWV